MSILGRVVQILKRLPRLHIDIGADERGELRRQVADIGGLQAIVVDQARHFDGRGIGQRGDHAIVPEIAVDDRGFARPDRIDDGRHIPWTA